jgi:periplasmic divalent cation tolerance protein
MKSARKFLIVLVTAPDLKVARLLARSALKARLVACANLVPRIESHYWWRRKLERSAEVLLILKTSRHHLAALERLFLSLHPYDTAEILALPVGLGTPRYLRWLADSVK